MIACGDVFICLGKWGVEGDMCKILELYDQNSWRNILSKLATFDPILQRPHSALVHLADSALPSSLSLISKNLQNQEMKGNHF